MCALKVSIIQGIKFACLKDLYCRVIKFQYFFRIVPISYITFLCVCKSQVNL